jgi:photosystem II stability/assembly factor-like uncharacterized protein
LVEREGQTPILWQAAETNSLLHQGYLLLTVPRRLQTPSRTPQTGIDYEGTAVWESNRLAGRSILDLAVAPTTPTTIYAGTDIGLYKSIDGGVSWSSTGLLDPSVNSIAIDPLTPTTIYTGTGSGLFKSTDGGENWISLIRTSVLSLAIDPLTPTTIYAGSGYGIEKSTSGGEDWTTINNGMETGRYGEHLGTVLTLAIDPITPTTLYAGTASFTHLGTWRHGQGHIYKSTDGGENWNVIYASNESIFDITINPITPNILYCALLGGIEKSEDGGAGWDSFSNGIACASVNALLIDPSTPTTLYAGLDCGIFKRMDAGEWNEFSPTLTKNEIISLAVDPAIPTTLYVGTKGSGVFVFR